MPDFHCFSNLQVCVLAAGFSKRFGRGKLLETMSDGRYLIDHSLEPYLELELPLVVFLREDDGELRMHLDVRNISNVTLRDVSEGMSVTVRAAAAYAQTQNLSFTVFALADMPYLDVTVLTEFLKSIHWQDKLIAAPYSDKEARLGNPVLFSRSFLPEFELLSGDQGARPVINNNRESLQRIACQHPGFYRDVDRPSDLMA
ncbi:nucleotidyltransferase family protein [Pseudoteredinibacter isoporae]|uniref:Molybdenum cofactor cytidylyltransferase n=1 Tax=Pseudoteredinibacter isoporae TaxID=570281 RepID=A0A7X0JRW1_9GAMM|nr:nucleotidyltransferase family protein [Pseudoteredinibacter isoporae]MBB6520649.1 molybdenum cofactor cytidylyltransferase [Pseudoteredinibacter isoporae]NHO86216.1 nucleotidyltransferase family protein [Pseudoteredinibacter isoporae]NIB25333.1 nucleotidyltransferase family protein [Pseudoteredinibacter isoporae]